ncbi:MAG: hypothetical protein JSU85_04545 [Candidatus Zixiibacteriota bacterium]|nr:MAG: hypothetical protein JSU85_04545 [candidate division Zixibacteria bacterium]
MRKIILVILITLISENASALIFGIRYSNLNEPVLQGTDFNGDRGRFGAFIGLSEKNNVVFLGLDYDRHKTERADTTFYGRRFTVNMGYRYRIFPTDKVNATKINPFVGLHFFKSFSKVEADESVMSSQERGYLKDMLNDTGGWLSFGAEYYFAPTFSLGAEAGIRYARAKSKAYAYEIKVTDYTSFVAILLSFYWQ